MKSGPVYQLTMQATGSPKCPFSDFVWKNRAPPRVQFFAWLMVLQRLNCRANLKHKHLLDVATCELCGHGDEDCDHLFLFCPFAAQVWSKLGMDVQNCEVQTIWTVPHPATIPARHFDSFLLLVCWNIWKHRNEVVFRNLPPSHERLWCACKDEARDWSYRWRAADLPVNDSWCLIFSNM